MFKFRKSMLPMVPVLAFGVSNAMAQDKGGQLEEIVVTATKRETTVQDTPISLSVISGKTLEEMSIRNLEELSSYTPNLTIADTSVTTNIYMRGIGSGLDRGFEQSVGMFIDGIYMGRSKQYRAPMFDLERVEVLRGPQPVLFGKNTTVGAIKLETRKARPGDAFSAEISSQYEFEHDGKKISGTVGGSPTETLGVRAAVQYEKSDGFTRNTFRNFDDPGIEQWIGRLSGVWEPSDGLTISAKYEHSDYKMDGALGEPSKISVLPSGNALFDIAAARLLNTPVTGAFALDPQLDGVLNFRRSSGNQLGPQAADQKTDNGVITADYTAGTHTLTAVLGHSTYVYDLDNDIDYLPIPLLQQQIRERFHQTSAEVRLASEQGNTIDYMTGVYWQENKLKFLGSTLVNFEYLGPLVPMASGPVTISSFRTGLNYRLDTETASAFGQLTWNINDDLHLSAGGRYSDEKKKVDRPGFCINRNTGQPLSTTFISDVLARNSGLCPSLATFTRTRDEDQFTPSFQLQWDANDNLVVYAKRDKAFKSGGFNAANFASLADIEYEEERATGYELGAKATTSDNSAMLNVALFNTKFKDLQVTTLLANGQSLLSNAASARSRGLELDGQWAISEQFQIGGSGAFLNSEYRDYARGACNGPQRSAAVGTGVPCVQNLTGKTTSYAPDFSGNMFAEAKLPVATNLNLTIRGDVTYSDKYYNTSDLDPNTLQESYWKFDARVGVSDDTNTWDVSLLVKNISNKPVAVWGTGVPLLLGTYVAFTEMPRTVALQARYRFGAQ